MNMELWNRAKKTDPRRVKAITGKQYRGNSPQPYYIVERLTEEFGICGLGWGLKILDERMERLGENDVLSIARVELWFMRDGNRGSIEQIGQTKAAYMTSKGSLMVDEDAPKKSVTDALVKCASYLGFAGDIFSGQWDDSKYVQQLEREFAQADSQMPESSKLDFLAAISEAGDTESLKRAFTNAYTTAQQGGDQKAIAEFTQAKDKRKAQLEQK